MNTRHPRLPAVFRLKSTVFALSISVLAATTADTSRAAAWRTTPPHEYDIRPGPGVTDILCLGTFHPPLSGTVANSPVFVLDSGKPGGTLFVLGGCHPSEPAGILAALLLVERAVCEQGRVVVVPYGNSLAVHPPRNPIPIDTGDEIRMLFQGYRRSIIALHEEDPEEYESPSGRTYTESGDARNLNRTFPGRADGNATEQIAYAIIQVMKAFETDVAMDLHESATPWNNLAWTIGGRSELRELIQRACHGVNQALELDLMRPRFGDANTGTTQSQWGPVVGAKAFLTETVYGHVTPQGMGFEAQTPLPIRVGIQIECVRHILRAFNDAHPEKAVRLDNMPAFHEIRDRGMDAFFQ